MTPTFESIAKSAKFIQPKKSSHKPLPCETGADFENAGIDHIISKYPVLDMDFMNQVYFDYEHKTELPTFAFCNVLDGIATSENRSKFNPKLQSIVTEKREKWPFYVIAGASIAGGLIGGFFFGTSTAIIAGVVSALYATFSLSNPINFYADSHFTVRKFIKIFSYKFEGQIPDDVRAIYHKEKANFDSIHLICDAKNRWIAEERPLPPPNPDPLLIGAKKIGENKHVCFLLAKFDLTPSEQYVVDEFAI